jgi:serine/threonine protein kinase
MKAGVFQEEYISIVVRELLHGLEYLHSEGRPHLDVKGALFWMIGLVINFNIAMHNQRPTSSFRPTAT